MGPAASSWAAQLPNEEVRMALASQSGWRIERLLARQGLLYPSSLPRGSQSRLGFLGDCGTRVAS